MYDFYVGTLRFVHPTLAGVLELMTQKKKYWRIVGYDSTKKIYEDIVLLGCFSEGQMEVLLRALVSRASLTYEEIVDSYSKKTARRYRSLLEVSKETHPKFNLMCGSDPHFVASVIEK